MDSLQAVAGGQRSPGTVNPSDTAVVVAVLSSLRSNNTTHASETHYRKWSLNFLCLCEECPLTYKYTYCIWR